VKPIPPHDRRAFTRYGQVGDQLDRALDRCETIVDEGGEVRT
jgi:hypothetical protein